MRRLRWRGRRLSAGDRVGIGWRPELAAAILDHADRIDVLEVIAESLLDAPRREVEALRLLGRERPLFLHGVGLGLASSEPVAPRRIDRLARLAAAIEPAGWSEHLAFVRAGGIEIGHMAAAPRTEATIAGALANIRRAARIVGAAPAMENIATLIDPPASTLDEPAWTGAIVRQADVPLLLDLHNLYANACNFGHDPYALLDAMPLDRVSIVHLSGGVWIGAPGTSTQRLLDDHLHDVPDAVYDLLAHLATRVAGPLTVVLERDGRYPQFAQLLLQIERARRALLDGRRFARAAA